MGASGGGLTIICINPGFTYVVKPDDNPGAQGGVAGVRPMVKPKSSHVIIQTLDCSGE